MKGFEISTLILVATAAVALSLLQRGNLASYWKRKCTGYLWKRAYPKSSKAEIRAFLGVFVRAFSFKSTQKLNFAPSDKVMDIYRSLHPPKWTIADSLELETLAMDLEKAYGLVLEKSWSEDVTLGEIFELTQSSK